MTKHPKLDELNDYLCQGLSPRHGMENLRKLGRKIREVAEMEQSVAKCLALLQLAQIYWLIAKIVDELSIRRASDLYKDLESYGAPNQIDAKESDCEEILKLLQSLEWRTEQEPDQISPGPLLFFSQYTKPAGRDLKIQRHGGALRAPTQDELARKRAYYG
ncbi:MAG: hypothetical protein WC761_02670 [Candidatus Paceibacterota bacterium]|jgi:hypothetical protein